MRLLLQNLFFSLVVTASCQAQEQAQVPAHAAWGKSADGWHFYKPNPVPPPEKKEKERQELAPRASPAGKAAPSYKERLEQWQADFAEAKAQAILEPTNTNVERVQRMHRYITDQSVAFGSKWMEVSLRKGILTYEDANGSPLHLEVQKQQKIDKIKRAFEMARQKNFGLFYLSKAGCPYCEKFAPLVKGFAQENGLSVLEIYDGAPTGVFDAQPNNGIADELNQEGIYPMLYLVNPQNKHFHPISRGMSTQSQLIQNAHMVLEELIQEGTLR